MSATSCRCCMSYQRRKQSFASDVSILKEGLDVEGLLLGATVRQDDYAGLQLEQPVLEEVTDRNELPGKEEILSQNLVRHNVEKQVTAQGARRSSSEIVFCCSDRTIWVSWGL